MILLLIVNRVKLWFMKNEKIIKHMTLQSE